jgi:hypothetical protein
LMKRIDQLEQSIDYATSEAAALREMLGEP